MSFNMLANYLPEFYKYLEEPDVVEMSLNPDGAVFVERFGLGSECVGMIKAADAERFIRFCAAQNNLSLTFEHPILSTRVPGTLHRIEAVIPPVVQASSFSIRRHGAGVVPLETFVGDPELEALIRGSIKARDNIVVAGATASGKTTFLNSCLDTMAEQSPDARLLLLEDTQELQSQNANTLSLLASPHVSLDQLLVSSLRLAPDRIIVGEVRTGAVLMTLLKSWNTGHPGGLTTIHANGAADVIDRFRMLASEVAVSDQRDFIGRAVDVILFLERDIGAPLVRQMIRLTNTAKLETLYER